MTAWLVAAIGVALLTAAQIIVHAREYGLLVWPPHRSAGRPRLPGILRWEAGYYLLLCFWLASSWFVWETLPPGWLTSAILVFSASHILGYWSVRTELEQLADATRTVKRDSSVSELGAMLAHQYKSHRWMMAFVGVHDGLELLMFAWILLYLVSAAPVSSY